MNATTFQFPVIPRLSIDTKTAARILADPSPSESLAEWIVVNNPKMEFTSLYYEVTSMASELGRHLTAQAIAQSRQLTFPTEGI